MRIALTLVVGLALAVGTGAAAGRVAQTRTRALYQENVRLEDERARLDKQLAEINLQIDKCTGASANLDVAYAANAKYMAKEFGAPATAR
jgi:hypothetical protein